MKVSVTQLEEYEDTFSMRILLLAIWGSMLNKGVKTASKNYGAVQPALADYAPQVEKRVSSGVRAVNRRV